MALASGATFAGYTVLRMLDFGPMGEVYLAQHPRLARRVALRVLPAAAIADNEFRQRFLREADIAARLHHPNILAMYDRGECDGRLWITTEHIDGTNVGQLMAKRYPSGMPAGEVLAIIAAVAGGLDYAHQRGLLHRDVKPANILLTDPSEDNERILLSEFGLARYLGERSGVTASNLTAESVGYAAPELLKIGADIDGRVDQYGLAATAFQLFTGAPPFEDSNPIAIIRQHRNAAPPKLSDRRPELAALDGVLVTAMAKQPANRFGRCHELADALIERAGPWFGDRSPQAVWDVVDYPDEADGATELAASANAGSERGQQQPAPATRRWPWVLLGAATGAAAALLGVVLVVVIASERKNDHSSPQAASPTTSRPPAASPKRTPNTPGPGQILDGAYQVDVNREQQTYNDSPDPQPPNVSTWWAFRTSCTPTGCVAAGIMLDDKNHEIASAQGGDHPLVLDFRDGAWQSRPETVRFPCVGPTGAAAKQTTKQVLSLQPQGNGPLHGVMTVTVQTDECRQQGAEIVIPATAGRTGDVPPGVSVPEPPTSPATTAAPTTTPTR